MAIAEARDRAEQGFLPPPRSGFVEGKCSQCGKLTFSKGKINKHKCKK